MNEKFRQREYDVDGKNINSQLTVKNSEVNRGSNIDVSGQVNLDSKIFQKRKGSIKDSVATNKTNKDALKLPDQLNSVPLTIKDEKQNIFRESLSDVHDNKTQSEEQSDVNYESFKRQTFR